MFCIAGEVSEVSFVDSPRSECFHFRMNVNPSKPTPLTDSIPDHLRDAEGEENLNLKNWVYAIETRQGAPFNDQEGEKELSRPAHKLVTQLMQDLESSSNKGTI